MFFSGWEWSLNCVPSLGSAWLKMERSNWQETASAHSQHPRSSPGTKQLSVANAKSCNVGRCCINVSESRCLLYGLDRASADQFELPYNGNSNAPVYMKINKSVRQNIKCTLLLLFFPKKLIFFYDIQSIKLGNWFFTTATMQQTSELFFCFVLLVFFIIIIFLHKRCRGNT